MRGNTGNVYVYEWPGNPTDVEVDALNPPRGSLIVDNTTGIWYRKTTGYNDNSGFVVVADSADGFVASVTAPANSMDFSMFPGAVAPGAGSYLAFDGIRLWSINAGESKWSYTDRNNN